MREPAIEVLWSTFGVQNHRTMKKVCMCYIFGSCELIDPKSWIRKFCATPEPRWLGLYEVPRTVWRGFKASRSLGCTSLRSSIRRIDLSYLFQTNSLYVFDPKALHHIIVKDQHIFGEPMSSLRQVNITPYQCLLTTLGMQTQHDCVWSWPALDIRYEDSSLSIHVWRLILRCR